MNYVRPSTIVQSAILFLFASLFAGECSAETYKCKQSDGQLIYQNWPCGSKVEIERLLDKQPDYPKIVACGLISGLDGTGKALIGKKPEPANCAK
ncbi:MAG: hypothetical protein ABIK25_09835 [Pseudomonadota bacterium]